MGKNFICLKDILDLMQFSDEIIFLHDKKDNCLLRRLFVDVAFIPFYDLRVVSIESTYIKGCIKVMVDLC